MRGQGEIKMTNEEINKYIHVEIMEKVEPKCNHYWDEREPDWLEKCEYCGFEKPDYCSDDSPRRLLNEVVAKIQDQAGTPFPYIDALARSVPRGQRGEATALQIATAAVEAHKVLNSEGYRLA